MKLEEYSVEKLREELLRALSKHLDLSRYRVFFFGSRVQGKGGRGSDVDVGIEGPPIDPLKWSNIQEEIENLPTLYRIDLVDFNTVSQDFRKEALKHIEVIHEPET
ncbi:MAG: nucleotidyltransferase family protein [Aquificaceae bacterium]|jgi:predicted nucleotidyltransferase|uniref:nucleotidyltransferase family protein n=1 Tax=Hydrogenobacter sp. Uz 6-8 TaxID=3384828 RepID=UPI0030AFF8C3